MRKKWNKDLYCQFLLASQRNFTATQASDLSSVSHDQITRWLHSVKLTPNILWEHVKSLVEKEGGVLVVMILLLQNSIPDHMSCLCYLTNIQEHIIKSFKELDS